MGQTCNLFSQRILFWYSFKIFFWNVDGYLSVCDYWMRIIYNRLFSLFHLLASSLTDLRRWIGGDGDSGSSPVGLKHRQSEGSNGDTHQLYRKSFSALLITFLVDQYGSDGLQLTPKSFKKVFGSLRVWSTPLSDRSFYRWRTRCPGIWKFFIKDEIKAILSIYW